MASLTDAGNFYASLGCLFSSQVDELATRLQQIAGLHARERDIILAATQTCLRLVLHGRLSRLLVLELHAARADGRLPSEDAGERWNQFIEISSGADFWRGLANHYPNLRARIDRLVQNRCEAALQFAERWAADRAELAPLCGAAPGELLQLDFGAGDSHRRGQTVALLRCAGGRLVYKPRPVAVDAALAAFVAELASEHASSLSVRVPRVLSREEYGWSECIDHRYAADAEELQGFYRGIGQWLAILGLLGGTDLHAENLIAHGPHPVVIDCETLFTPKAPPKPSGFGQASDRAAELVAGTVLSIGMLPGRGAGLGWRGVDTSAVGSLPGQQPMVALPDLLKGGTDQAYIGTSLVAAPVVQNHPSASPVLSSYWPAVLAAFDETTATLRRLDDEGSLRARLERFADCRVRVVPRATEVYAELSRMLWHPVSLHKEQPARERARELMSRMARNVATAPGDPAVIEAEIEDLLDGDIPFFCTQAGLGRLDGPRGTRWLPRANLVDAALDHWRQADPQLERQVIQAALVSAYINEGWMPDEASLWPAQVQAGRTDARRREQAARIMRATVASAIRGDDGSAAWIAPVFTPGNGWAIKPIGPDVYGGLAGVALLTAAYLRESRAGRADPVDGLEGLLAAVVSSLDLAEAKWESQRRDSLKVRPLPVGGYFGLGSLIWARLLLDDLGASRDGLARACALAEVLAEADAASEQTDLVGGTAGAIVPLLALARRSGEARYLEMACALGDRLCRSALCEDGAAHWANAEWPSGIGGFAHGVTGIGWALAKLGCTSARRDYQETARAAFAFEDVLYDEDLQGWRDLRMLPGAPTAAAWCHGAVGIALARLDLDPHLQQPGTRLLLRRAAAATWRQGLGWNHAACHGDASACELLDLAIRAGEAPEGLSREHLLDGWLTSLEQHGPICGMVRDTFSPGLMSGFGGIAYQLLRADPHSELPSILLLGGAAL